jgi:hypothetical protein
MTRAAILSDAPTATTDYFLAPYLKSLGYDALLLESRVRPSDVCRLNGCAVVVISRYLPVWWLSTLQRLRREGTKIVYFMDDDLFDLRALRGLPWRYQWKVLSRAIVHRQRLQRLCDEFWVSTAFLAEKYAALAPVVLDPLVSLKTQEAKTGLHVCYHGTASHMREIEWLVPVVEAVQARSDFVHFELFGTRAVQKLFGRIPRVSVVHPMNWPNYLSFTSVQKRDLALAPLLPSAFNAGRGPLKFFDYARMGAVGLYSDRPPYRGFIRDGVDGLLLPHDHAAWIDAVLQLAQDSERRRRMASAVQLRVAEMGPPVQQSRV